MRCGKSLWMAIVLALAPCLVWAKIPNDGNPTANDGIFPATGDAAKRIAFDGAGFTIDGRRVFITSGSVHYARVPRQNWRDILLKLKRCGFNTVETYVFWNYHEESPGNFDFTTDSRDIGAFLATAQQVGLYATVRVGPYVCAEWENGGFPTWLQFEPGLQIRKDNPGYLAAVDRWFGALLPIVAAHQIQNGGNVILVQLENELPTDHWKHWGTDTTNTYLTHLLSLAHQHGLQVPMYFSGLHHGKDPAPAVPVNTALRGSPWLTTELWTDWFDQYGSDPQRTIDCQRHPWRVLAQGGGGFNLYMFHGGTTFGYFNFDNDKQFGDRAEKGAATYDYGTLVGQTGDIRPLYYGLKRLGYFAQSFSDILADGNDTSASFRAIAPNLQITARTAPAGSLIFLNNPGPATRIALPGGASTTLEAGEIVGLVRNVQISAGVFLKEANSRILSVVQQGPVKTLICYGTSGESGSLSFQAAAGPLLKGAIESYFTLPTKDQPYLKFVFPDHGVGSCLLTFGSTAVRILTMTQATADHTWIVSSPNSATIVIGPAYLGEMSDEVSHVNLQMDVPLSESSSKDITICDQNGLRTITTSFQSGAAYPEHLSFDSWQVSADDAALAPTFDDRAWFAQPDGSPPEIGQDGNPSPYAWYRAELKCSAPISAISFARIGDQATFFVDGKPEAAFDLKKDKSPKIQLQIPSGQHELAVFARYPGRSKFSGYTGPMDALPFQKGLRDPVTFVGQTNLTPTWRIRGGEDPDDPPRRWTPASADNPGPAFYRTTVHLDAAPPAGAVYRLSTTGLSAGSVWLNGHNLGRYPEIVKNCPGIWLPSCWMTAGENTLTIFDEQGKFPAAVGIDLEPTASRQRIVVREP